MTVSTVLAVIAITCSTIGVTGMAADWWTRRHPPHPPGRHRAPVEPVPGLSATAILAQARADTGRLPAIPHPTRAQLRDEAAHQ